MPTVEHKIVLDNAFKNVKSHFERHKVAYSFGAGVAIAGITCLIMRGVYSHHIGGTVGTPAQGTVGTLGKSDVSVRSLNLLSNRPNIVTVIENGRQGPPSWVVRCKETSDIFMSQKAAAISMGLPQDHLSNHLNGGMDHVRGFTFERICMAAA